MDLDFCGDGTRQVSAPNAICNDTSNAICRAHFFFIVIICVIFRFKCIFDGKDLSDERELTHPTMESVQWNK